MTVVIIARDIVQYFESLGEGVFGQNIFVDMQPDQPADCITVFDAGGNTQDPPENWRELYIQVRCQNHSDGYERIWRVLNYILYPSSGVIGVGANKYTAQLQEIPAIFDRDQNGRYLFGFRVIVRNIADNTAADPWLEALATWTGAVLEPGWTVYKVWPGNKRPSICWRLAGIEVQEKARAMFEMRKKFIGHVLGSTPNEQIAGALTVVQELGNAIKLPLDVANKRYLTVNNPAVDYRTDALTAGQVSLTLSRLTNRPAEEAPLIMAVHNTGFIQD